MPVRVVAHRAREELVPGGEGGGRAVDHDLELAAVAREVRAHAGPLHQGPDLLAQHHGQQPALVVLAAVEPAQELREVGGIGTRGAGRGLLDQLPALDQLEADRDVGIVLLA